MIVNCKYNIIQNTTDRLQSIKYNNNSPLLSVISKYYIDRAVYGPICWTVITNFTINKTYNGIKLFFCETVTLI